MRFKPTAQALKAVERYGRFSPSRLVEDLNALARSLDQFGWPERAGLVAAAADCLARLALTQVDDGDMRDEIAGLRDEIAGLPGDPKYREGAEYALNNLLGRMQSLQRSREEQR